MRYLLSLTLLPVLSCVLHAQDLDAQLPQPSKQIPFQSEVPIRFVNRAQNADQWDKLPSFWTNAREKAVDPDTGLPVERKTVVIKVPLGLTQNPPIPVENPITLAKWALGKRLYFDTVMSSDGTVSCSSCHAPDKGYTDQSPVSVGIGGNKGGVSAPTVMNAAFNHLQFWDGRAASLEDQAQGPPQNPIEMTTDKTHAWDNVVKRVRAKGDYTKQFQRVFGHEPTRDAIAKAIATYERTVLTGNSIHDRAELAMRERVADEGGNFVIAAKDYETVLKNAFDRKDANALKALGLTDATKIADAAKSINQGRVLFFNKARCNTCHAGDNFTDNQFHNLGVRVKDGKIAEPGRFGAQPTGHKNPELMGAFKTPTLRGLLSTAPYMHDGSEDTLEKVVEFYNKGGNPSAWLSSKMRDTVAEQLVNRGTSNPNAKKFDGRVIVPFQLQLTDQEKKDLVLFLRALQGDPVDPMIADPEKFPDGV